MSNSVDGAFLADAIAIEADRIELDKRMKAAGKAKHEIAGTKLAAKRHFKDAAKVEEAKEFRSKVEAYAEQQMDLFATATPARAAVSRGVNIHA
jgi:hypothetical protein